MLTIDKNIPIPPPYMGRKSKHRASIISAMGAMEVGDSFTIEYKLASMRNLIRNSGVSGSFRAALDKDENHVRVWRIE